MWRQQPDACRASPSCRFISTCVETACDMPPHPSPQPVHLHVCGDSALIWRNSAAWYGSSPRVWRQHNPAGCKLPAFRFISTCVETAPGTGTLVKVDPVHLHVCGDSAGHSHRKLGAHGSSPRVWRQRSSSIGRRVRKRFISTCVETAFRDRTSASVPTVHLHVCGDSTVEQLITKGFQGSSPRVWRQLIITRNSKIG